MQRRKQTDSVKVVHLYESRGISDFRFPTSEFGLRSFDFGVSTTGFGVPTADFRMSSADCRVPSAFISWNIYVVISCEQHFGAVLFFVTVSDFCIPIFGLKNSKTRGYRWFIKNSMYKSCRFKRLLKM